MKKIILLLILLLPLNFIFAQNYKQVKIYIKDINESQKLINYGIEVDHAEFTKDGHYITFLNDEEFIKLSMSNYQFEVLIDNWFEHYNSRQELSFEEKRNFVEESKELFGVENFGFGSMGGFYTLNEAIAQLDTMRFRYPNLITEKVSIGNSVENRPIYMVRISNSPQVIENEPEVLYTALHHAREPQGMMQMIYFMYYLLENYNTNSSVKYLVDNRQLFFIPVLNPDGYEYNRSQNPNGGGMWRKNRRNNGSSFGIDLNRNYGPMNYWNAPNNGSSTSPTSETYRGPSPFSEPEISALRDFITSRNIKNVLNYHTYSNLLIYPYGALSKETPDSLIFREFANEMTKFNNYTVGTDMQTVGYSTRGNSDDYMYDGDTLANGGKIFAMTPEVGSSSDGFWPNQNRIFPLAQENVFPNLYYAWVAGGYATLNNINFQQQYFNPGDVVTAFPQIKNKGLSSINNVTAELISLSTDAAIINGLIEIPFIERRSSVNAQNPVTFSISQNVLAETEIKLLFRTKTGNVIMSEDTLNFIIGIPTYTFIDTTNNPLNYWTVAATPANPKWEATTQSYYSSPVSFTESKDGQYANNATVTMTTTNSIDLNGLTNPRFVFWTRFDIESNWDYGQVEISTNNGTTWSALQGNYTESGVGSFQPSGQPVYDGSQLNWVREEILLSQFAGQQVKFRFKLRTDGSQTRDGWYVDDIGIVTYTLVPVELVSFNANVINNNIVLNWITGSETNNLGFEIQRTIKNEKLQITNWEKIGFVDGNGTTTGVNNYIFTDASTSQSNEKTTYRLKQIDYDGSFRYFGPISVESITPDNFVLLQNYPNPFNPSTEIRYQITEDRKVSLIVYDILGNIVSTLVNENQSAGSYSKVFNGKELSSGIYYYTLRAGEFVSTKKMILIK